MCALFQAGVVGRFPHPLELLRSVNAALIKIRSENIARKKVPDSYKICNC